MKGPFGVFMVGETISAPRIGAANRSRRRQSALTLGLEMARTDVRGYGVDGSRAGVLKNSDLSWGREQPGGRPSPGAALRRHPLPSDGRGAGGEGQFPGRWRGLTSAATAGGAVHDRSDRCWSRVDVKMLGNRANTANPGRNGQAGTPVDETMRKIRVDLG